jgi:hypothetical protein
LTLDEDANRRIRVLLVILARDTELTATITWLRTVQRISGCTLPAIAVVAKSSQGEVTVSMVHRGDEAAMRSPGTGDEPLAVVMRPKLELGDGVLAQVVAEARKSRPDFFQYAALSRVGSELAAGSGAVVTAIGGFGDAA